MGQAFTGKITLIVCKKKGYCSSELVPEAFEFDLAFDCPENIILDEFLCHVTVACKYF